MKTLNTFKNTLVTLTLLAAINAPTVSAAPVNAQLQINAQTLLAVTLEENLNQVVTTINDDLKKDIMTKVNDKSLVLELAASQSVKDDKTISAVSDE